MGRTDPSSLLQRIIASTSTDMLRFQLFPCEVGEVFPRGQPFLQVKITSVFNVKFCNLVFIIYLLFEVLQRNLKNVRIVDRYVMRIYNLDVEDLKSNSSC